MSGYRLTEGSPERLGLVCDADGANVAVFSEHAERIELCLFKPDGRREATRLVLPERTGAVHHGHVAGLGPGQQYGLRAHGPYAPKDGHRFNPAKLLLDPYATGWTTGLVWHPSQAGDDPADPGRPEPTDSAPHMPRCIAAGPVPEAADTRPRVPWSETVIYEAHVRNLTRLWPGLDPGVAGTVEALGTPAVIEHLAGLGITAVELMPIHACIDEPRLTGLGLTNHWGYNSVGFFVADPRVLGPRGLAGLVETVGRLHAAGIEVILDVVYNHTGEGDDQGPTLSFRGLDNASYYRADPQGAGGYANDTGCGNTVDLAHPMVLRMVLDSLRWWVRTVGVDGFRFDLAPALVRGPTGFDPGTAFLAAALQDPVLAGVKLIAEPWDIGPDGHRVGAFPAPFAEWNDHARDAVRSHWRGDPGAHRDTADVLLGSARTFDRDGRRAWSSVNFVACHDGFTLADLTMFDRRHNQANGEDNRDGHGDNRSDNMGHEGPTDDPSIAERRGRRQRAMIATILLAQGTPMILAGDEIGHTQRGNNNAYCQDNEISWIDWSARDPRLEETVRRCLAIRRAYPVLRQPDFLHAGTRASDGAPEVLWFGADGDAPDWEDQTPGVLGLVLHGAAGAPLDRPGTVPVALVLNNGAEDRDVRLPDAASLRWRLMFETTAADRAGEAARVCVAGQSLAVFVAEAEETAS